MGVHGCCGEGLEIAGFDVGFGAREMWHVGNVEEGCVGAEVFG